MDPPLTVSRLEGLHGSCSSCRHSQYYDHSPTASIGCYEDQELSTPTSFVGDFAEVTLGGHSPDSATKLSPGNPPLGSLNNSDQGGLPVGFVPFYAPSAKVADLALALAQKAGVDTCSEDSPAHGGDY